MDVTKQCRNTSELTPQAQKACGLFLSECKKQGLNVLITETYRSQERQDYLYAQGRSRQGKIVTWTKNSIHTSRNAWDICKNVKGQEYNDSNFFKQCGEIAKKLNITWGGEWTPKDVCHFQITGDWKEPIKPHSQNGNEYINALHILMAKGIINNPKIWKSDAISKKNVESLIIKIAKVLN